MYVEGMEFGKDTDSRRCSVSSHGTETVYSKALEEVMEKTRTFAEVIANGGRTKVIGAKKGTKEKEVNEYISVNNGRNSFQLLVEEERTLVELRWIENFLDLDLVLRKPKRWNRGQGQVESMNSIGQSECQDREGKGGPTGAATDEIQLLGNGDGHYKPVKGKNIRISSPNRYLPLHNYANSNNKLILEKTKVIGVFKDQRSSIDSEMERGPFMNLVKSIGECSTQRQNLIGQTLLDMGVESVQDLVDFSVKDGLGTRDDGLDIDRGNIVGLVSALGGLGSTENNRMDLDNITTKANDVRLIGSSKATVQTTKVERVDLHIELGSVSAQKFKKSGSKGNLKARLNGKEAKKIQLMMKRGLLRSSLN
ncbi:hypothetical protein LWI29_019599 [Acer saccharum]|uniref:Uncharacterized protein n=1 Tax=Acer saccharum TaxID=4024 RepID=A0AA39T4A3_ACESA|nr:hypothetical protein LWI29_019599 [Acer saccharum]